MFNRFKHLDLKTDNILVFSHKNKSKGKFNKYVVGNREFYLRYGSNKNFRF